MKPLHAFLRFNILCVCFPHLSLRLSVPTYLFNEKKKARWKTGGKQRAWNGWKGAQNHEYQQQFMTYLGDITDCMIY